MDLALNLLCANIFKRLQWNITCLENQWMLSLVGTSHFAGIIVGSALFGVLADRYVCR